MRYANPAVVILCVVAAYLISTVYQIIATRASLIAGKSFFASSLRLGPRAFALSVVLSLFFIACYIIIKNNS